MLDSGQPAANLVIECIVVLALSLVSGMTYLYTQSEQRLTQVYPTQVSRIEIPDDRETLARGRHLAVHVGLCTWCHGDDLSGKQTANSLLVGQLHSSNLTRGAGGIADYDALDLARAIRDGIRPDGRSLLRMPSRYLRALTDEDLAAIIAWLGTVKPVDARRPESRPGPLTRLALVAGLAPELIAAAPVAPRAGDENESFGAYLVDIASCRVCHHANLAGGPHPLSLPNEPSPPDLTASGPLSTWSRDDFHKAMRTGVTPDGRSLSATYMPWPHFAGMTDPELNAIWRYLQALPGAREAG